MQIKNAPLILERMGDWFNPFFIEGYKLTNIHFYDEDGIKFSTGYGWLSKPNESNNPFNELTLNVCYTRKTKPDFSLSKKILAFYIPVKKTAYETLKCAELYLPLNAWTWTENVDERKYELVTLYYATLVNNDYGFMVEKLIQQEENVPNREFFNESDEIYNLMGLSCDHANHNSVLENKQEILKKAKALVEKWSNT
jgi:hypothetical protein